MTIRELKARMCIWCAGSGVHWEYDYTDDAGTAHGYCEDCGCSRQSFWQLIKEHIVNWRYKCLKILQSKKATDSSVL